MATRLARATAIRLLIAEIFQLGDEREHGHIERDQQKRNRQRDNGRLGGGQLLRTETAITPDTSDISRHSLAAMDAGLGDGTPA